MDIFYEKKSYSDVSYNRTGTAIYLNMFFEDYGTFLTSTLILFGKFVILYGY